MSFKTLVLNADYKPLSYFPLSICNWKESIKAVFLEKVLVENLGRGLLSVIKVH